MQKLFFILLPELAEHFKIHKIDTHYFATSWFVTVFT